MFRSQCDQNTTTGPTPRQIRKTTSVPHVEITTTTVERTLTWRQPPLYTLKEPINNARPSSRPNSRFPICGSAAPCGDRNPIRFSFSVDFLARPRLSSTLRLASTELAEVRQTRTEQNFCAFCAFCAFSRLKIPPEFLPQRGTKGARAKFKTG